MVSFHVRYVKKYENNSECFKISENFNGVLKNTQLDRCTMHKDIWQKMSKSSNVESQLSVCQTIQDALDTIHDIKDNNVSAHINALFTGSLHLVGSTLGLLNKTDEASEKKSMKAKRIRT